MELWDYDAENLIGNLAGSSGQEIISQRVKILGFQGQDIGFQCGSGEVIQATDFSFIPLKQICDSVHLTNFSVETRSYSVFTHLGSKQLISSGDLQEIGIIIFLGIFSILLLDYLRRLFIKL